MTYKLAKQLKEAGFPQVPLGTIGAIEFTTNGKKYQGFGNGAYIPTLSELIGECGEKFGWLDHAEAVNEKKEIIGRKWCAFEFVSVAEMKKPFVAVASEGWDTPEEAVANLWLRLNEKNIG